MFRARTKARRALEELLQEVCEALWAPSHSRRGQANDKREIGELFRESGALKERAKLVLDTLEPLFKNLEADVGATLNVAAHGSRGRLGAAKSRPRWNASRWTRRGSVRNAGRASGTAARRKPDAASAARARSLPLG